MQAITFSKYGPPEVLSLTEVATPEISDGQILIRVHATTINSADWRARTLTFPPGFGPVGRLVFGIFGPRKPILGIELAGVVEKIGPSVSKFSVGDPVFAATETAFGAHAEYVAIDQDAAIAPKPKGLSFEKAAAISFGGVTALDFLQDKAAIKPGETVLIVGASGTVGLAMVQLARYFGGHVTAVCSGGNRELVIAAGAQKVIDYKTEDFSESGDRYDIVADITATVPWKKAKKSLTSTGRMLLISGSLADMLRAPFVSRKNGKKLIAGVSVSKAPKLRFLAGLVESGNFDPIIDRAYPFENFREAHSYVDSGRKKGSVVLTIIPDKSGTAAA